MGAIREKATSRLIEVVEYYTNYTVERDSTIVDTKDYEAGITFVLGTNDLPPGDKRTLTFEHSDTDVPGDFVPVDRSNLVYGRDGTDVYVENKTLSPVDGVGTFCAIEGLIGTKRYVRARVKLTIGDEGDIIIFCMKNAEFPPPSAPGFMSGSVIYYPAP